MVGLADLLWNEFCTSGKKMQASNSPFSNAVDLKELPHKLDGAFSWLTATPPPDESAIGERCESELPSQLNSAITSAKQHGVKLPVEFVTFVGNPAIHNRIRSTSACYLSVADSLLPFADGYLIRFLADQQGCAFWYLYLSEDAKDHCVVMSFEYFDADEMDYEIDELKESDFQYQGESFEAFCSRYWLENEIQFARYEESPMPDVDPRVLDLYLND